MMQIATSRRTEFRFQFHIRGIRQTFQYRPRSTMTEAPAREYPSALVRMAGRMRGWYFPLLKAQQRIATENPPHARAVPITTSKAIQIPQGNPSFIPVVGPRPTTKRHASTRMHRAKTARAAMKGRVRMGPTTGRALWLISHPFPQALAAPGPVDRDTEDAVEDDGGDESLVHGVRQGFGQLGDGCVAQVRQAQFPERDPGGGQVEDLRPSTVGVPVDLREILFRFLGETALRVGPEPFKAPCLLYTSPSPTRLRR